MSLSSKVVCHEINSPIPFTIINDIPFYLSGGDANRDQKRIVGNGTDLHMIELSQTPNVVLALSRDIIPFSTTDLPAEYKRLYDQALRIIAETSRNLTGYNDQPRYVNVPRLDSLLPAITYIARKKNKWMHGHNPQKLPPDCYDFCSFSMPVPFTVIPYEQIPIREKNKNIDIRLHIQ